MVKLMVCAVVSRLPVTVNGLRLSYIFWLQFWADPPSILNVPLNEPPPFLNQLFKINGAGSDAISLLAIASIKAHIGTMTIAGDGSIRIFGSIKIELPNWRKIKCSV